MNDMEINNVRDLIKVINKHKVGDLVAVELLRGKKRVLVKTLLEKAPSTRGSSAPH